MFIEAKISQQQAWNIFTQIKPPFSFMKLSRQTLTKVELIYLPYYVFDLDIEHANSDVAIAVVGLSGSTMFLAKDELSFVSTSGSPACKFKISEDTARCLATQSFKSQKIEFSIRSKTMPKTGDIGRCTSAYYPFWIGYFQKRRQFDFKALDAISGELMGLNMRKVFIEALKEITA